MSTGAYRPSRVYVALVTPFADDDSVDHGVLERLTADALDAAADALHALGG